MSERGASDAPNWRTILMAVVTLLTMGVVVALVVTLGNANRERDRALALQAKSHEVMSLARGFGGNMARAEATLGRFVISGDRAIGQQYGDQWSRAARQLQRLDQVVPDDSDQQRQIETLRAAFRLRSDELATIALSTRYRKNDQALARFYRARDTQALRTIDRLLDEFVAKERDVLRERTQEAMATVRRSNRAAALFAVFGVLLMLGAVALAWLTARALAARAVSEAEAEAERSRAFELEAAVDAATAELHAEAAEREAAEGKLRQMQKLEAVGQLTGGIAHDFNNMLAVVVGGIELARRRIRDGVAEEAVRHLESATEGANRASALTRRLLAFARAEPLAPEAIDPADLVAGMADLLDRTLGDGIRVETCDDGARWAIRVDRHGLENAILNLAVNARDAMEGRGALTIATGGATLAAHQVGHCAAGDHAVIAVTDTGCGMTPEVLERAFEPFFTTKPVGKGTGLGLSQIFGFVRQSGGEVGIASAPDRGTTVSLYLPRHLAFALATADGASAQDEPHTAATGLDVFVLEDDPRVLGATIDALVELGHRPVACADPLDAVRLASTIPPPDLIISDVLMPGRTGPEVVAELAPRLPQTAVLFVTGYAGDGADAPGFGGHAVLRKPYTLAGLAAAIDEALARRDAHPELAAAE